MPPAAALVVPYFGRWPPWVDLTLLTMARNPLLAWHLFTDCGPTRVRPPNVTFHAMTLPELSRLARERLGVTPALDDAYKVCDLRPTFGLLFQDLLRPYSHWGFCDLDVVLGDTSPWLTPDVMQRDAVSFHDDRLSCHLCFLRNTDQNRVLFRRVGGWRDKLAWPGWVGMDDQLGQVMDRSRCSFRESFSTPLARDRPWVGGGQRWPGSWTWRDGVLTNDTDAGMTFPYLHFMVWRGGRWGAMHGGGQWERLGSVVHVTPDVAARGFRVDARGFHALEGV
jgi:hypothetical protein